MLYLYNIPKKTKPMVRFRALSRVECNHERKQDATVTE